MAASILFKKKNKVVYVMDRFGAHHVSNHCFKSYLKHRKNIPTLCILYNSMSELKDKLMIA